MDMHPAEIKAALEKAGTNFAKLAREHGYRHIHSVLRTHWVAAELIVANALNKQPEEIWPSRYEHSRARGRALTRNTAALRQLHTAARTTKA